MRPADASQGHQRGVTAIARESSSSTLVSGSYDGRVCTWSSAGIASPVTGPGHTNALVGVVAAGQSVLTAAMDDSIREVDVSSSSFACVPSDVHAADRLRPSFASTATLPKGIDAASDGTAFVATASDVQIVKGGKKLFGLPVNYAPTAIAATRDGKQVAVGAEDGKLYIYASSGSTLDLKSTLTANRSAVSALAFSPDGALLAAGEASGKVLLLIATSASFEVKTSRWSYHTGRILALAWSPDGAHVASASLDTHVYVWSVAAPLKKVAIKVRDSRARGHAQAAAERASGRRDERGVGRRCDGHQRGRRRHDQAIRCHARGLSETDDECTAVVQDASDWAQTPGRDMPDSVPRTLA